jgi:hypothetical protein
MTSKSVTLDLPSFGKKPVATATTPPSSPLSGTGMVTARPLPTSDADLPPLPKGKRPSFSSHRNDANAALAVDRLAEVHEAITRWHQTLRQTLLDIQALYQAGPIIEGWLEAVATATPPATSAGILRHGDPAAIAAYVDQLSQTQPATATTAGTNSQYLLCRLDDEGQLQCQPCPPEQLGAIGQAIARHQRLRQLVLQKQTLEERLQKAGASLGRVCGELGIGNRECV